MKPTLTVHSAANPEVVEIAGARFSEHPGTVADVSRTGRNAEKRDRVVVAALLALLAAGIAVGAAVGHEPGCTTQSLGSVEHWLAGCRVAEIGRPATMTPARAR